MNEKETSRIEAFSDGVFAIALTLLANDLKAPMLETINNANLTAAIVERWTEYFAFFNSFIVVLLMWVSHHCIFKIVRKTNTLFILANGLVLFFVAAVSYPTSVLAKFLLTDAAPAAAAFYAGYLFMANGAFIMLLRVISGNKNLLMNKVYDDNIRKLSHGLFMALPIYLAATLFAFVNVWITVAITSLLWVYWVITLKNELL